MTTGYDPARIRRMHAAIAERLDTQHVDCDRCEFLDYCTDATRSGDLLACELSDASTGTALEPSMGAKFHDEDEWEYPIVGTVRFSGKHDESA
jgi:hypothetical protein